MSVHQATASVERDQTYVFLTQQKKNIVNTDIGATIATSIRCQLEQFCGITDPLTDTHAH